MSITGVRDKKEMEMQYQKTEREKDRNGEKRKRVIDTQIRDNYLRIH